MKNFRIITVLLFSFCCFSHLVAAERVLVDICQQRAKGENCDLILEYDGKKYSVHSNFIRAENSKIEDFTAEEKLMFLKLDRVKCSNDFYVSQSTFEKFIDLSYQIEKSCKESLESLNIIKLYELFELLKFLGNKNIKPILENFLLNKLEYFACSSDDLLDDELKALVYLIKATNSVGLMEVLNQTRLKKMRLDCIEVRDIIKELDNSCYFGDCVYITHPPEKVILTDFSFDYKKVNSILNHFSNENFKRLPETHKKLLLGICVKAMEYDDLKLLAKILDTGFIDINQLFKISKYTPIEKNMGSTFLAYAAQLAAKNCFIYLIKHGADINTITQSPGQICHGRKVIDWAQNKDMKKFITEQI